MIGVMLGAGCCALDAEQTSNTLKAITFDNLMAASPNLPTIVTAIARDYAAAGEAPMVSCGIPISKSLLRNVKHRELTGLGDGRTEEQR
jgi:hypothetical protein